MNQSPKFPSFRHAGIALALCAAVLMAGCYGRFPLTRGIYQWNRDVSSDKYIRSIVFWPLSIVYLGAGLVDAVVINVLEFWSGNQVVDSAQLPDGSKVKMASAGHGAPLIITIQRTGQPDLQRQVSALGQGRFEVRDAVQQRLGFLQKRADGQFDVHDAQDKFLFTASPRQAALTL